MPIESDAPLAERLTRLEEEVKITKGEIKKVLLDIREVMNNMENPFYAMELGAPKQKTQRHEHVILQAKKQGDTEEEIPMMQEETEKLEKPEEIPVIPDLQSMSVKERHVELKTDDKKALPLITFFKLWRWTENMLKKIDQEKFRAIIELYEYSGNLEPNIKKLLLEISRLCTTMPMDKELLIELYRLNNILNPEKNDLKSLGEILEDEW